MHGDRVKEILKTAMEELIQEILMSMSKELDDMQLKKLQTSLIIKLSKYEINKKTTEVALYQGDFNEKCIQKWILAKKIQGCTKRTLELYFVTVTKILNIMNKNVSDITTDDVRLYMAQKSLTGVSEVSVNNELRCLSSFFNFLRDEGIISKSPTVSIPKMRTTKTKKEAFTEMEIEKMRNVLNEMRKRNSRTRERIIKYNFIFELLLSTGCRVSEICSIKISEIEDNVILVHGKGKKDRLVYLNTKAQFALKEYLKERKKDSEWLFPRIGHSSGIYNPISKSYEPPKEYLSTTNIEEIIRNIAKEAGVKKAHPHKFRRTCATFALRNGMPIEQVSQMLGHESVTTTQIYLDLDEKLLRQAHEKYVR